MAMFDTHRAVKKLTGAGFSEDQAEALIDAVRDEQEALATKADMLAVRADLREEISALRTELKEDIADLRAEVKEDITVLRAELKEDMTVLRAEVKEDITVLRAELKEDIAVLRADNNAIRSEMQALELRMTLRLGGLVAAGVAILAVLELIP